MVVQPLLMQTLSDESFIPKDLESLYFLASLIISLGIIISSFTQYSYTSLSTKLLFYFRSDIF